MWYILFMLGLSIHAIVVITFIVGMIKPKVVMWGAKKENVGRLDVAKRYGIVWAIVFFMLVISVAFMPESDKTSDENVINSDKRVEELERQVAELENTLKNKEEAEEDTKLNSANIEDIANTETREEDNIQDKFIMTDEIKAEARDTNYVLMWNEYSDNEQEYKGKYVRISGRVYSVTSSENTPTNISISEGLSGITGSISIDIEDANEYEVTEDDYVTIIGKVSSKIFGTIFIDNGYIEDVGEASKERTGEYRIETKETRDKMEKDAEKLEKERIDNIINSAVNVEYNDLIRNPEKYVGTVIKIQVKIAQEMVGGILTASGYRGYSGDDEWYISYELPEGSSRIIEGDTVTFYGTFDGLAKMKRAFTGVTDYVPRINADAHR